MANRVAPGDLTGRQKAEEAKEERRAADESRVAQAAAADDDAEARAHGVFDPKTGERLNGPEDGEALLVGEEGGGDPVELRPSPSFADRFPTPPSFGSPEESVFTGKETDIEAAAAAQEQRRTEAERRRLDPEIAHNRTARIRLAYDLEKMTFGMLNGEPNNYSFKAGLVYEVPWTLAQHLNDLGYVSHWL